MEMERMDTKELNDRALGVMTLFHIRMQEAVEHSGVEHSAFTCRA